MKVVKNIVIYLMVILVGMTGIPTMVKSNESYVSAASKNKKAMKAYKKILNKKMKGLNSKNSNVNFEIIDANHDGVSELFITNYDDCKYELYTYYKGKAKLINDAGDTGYCGYSFYKKGSVYAYGEMHHGYEEQKIYGIVKGKSKELASYSYYSGMLGESGSGDPEYKVNGKKVSESKYNKYLKKVTKNSKEISSNSHDITSSNIKKYVK